MDLDKEEDIILDFCSNAYTTVEGINLMVNNDELILVYNDHKHYIKVTTEFNADSGVDEVFLVLDNSDDVFICGSTDYCIDAFVDINRKYFNIESKPAEDEIDESADEMRGNFSRLNVDRILSDMSIVVISKLVYDTDNKLIGYRFRLNNGCLDISIEKGEELGIVPYKIGKRVPLQAVNGVLASKFECSNKILFPDVSHDDEICKKLLKAVLTQ